MFYFFCRPFSRPLECCFAREEAFLWVQSRLEDVGAPNVRRTAGRYGLAVEKPPLGGLLVAQKESLDGVWCFWYMIIYILYCRFRSSSVLQHSSILWHWNTEITEILSMIKEHTLWDWHLFWPRTYFIYLDRVSFCVGFTVYHCFFNSWQMGFFLPHSSFPAFVTGKKEMSWRKPHFSSSLRWSKGEAGVQESKWWYVLILRIIWYDEVVAPYVFSFQLLWQESRQLMWQCINSSVSSSIETCDSLTNALFMWLMSKNVSLMRLNALFIASWRLVTLRFSLSSIGSVLLMAAASICGLGAQHKSRRITVPLHKLKMYVAKTVNVAKNHINVAKTLRRIRIHNILFIDITRAEVPGPAHVWSSWGLRETQGWTSRSFFFVVLSH